MRKKMICFSMACLLMISAATPKKAYAIAGVDDVAVAIVLALTAAAGITFATSDGAKDAVKDFLKSSDGKYDSTLERLSASAVTAGGLSCFKIPVATWSGVKLLLEGLFSHFKVDENRKGAVTVSGGFDFPFVLRADDPRVKSFFKLEITSPVAVGYPVYLVCSRFNWHSDHGHFKECIYNLVSRYPFSYTYYSTFRDEFGVSAEGWISKSKRAYMSNRHGVDYCCSDNIRMRDCFSGFSSLFGVSVDSLPDNDGIHGSDEHFRTVFRALFSDSSAPPVDKSVPYGLTFPQDLTAPDVIDNFEQKVKEGAGDMAIAVPVDGVVDGTLPYDVAQEKYLVNVNELGGIGDTVTETNTWLQKILSSVKAIPSAVASAVVGSGTLDFSGFQNIGLSTVFPFCIPFDFVNCIRYFAVSEQVPQWSVDFSGSPLAAFGVFKINFERFSVWAKLLKFFLYSIFVVGLVKLTRHLIKG